MNLNHDTWRRLQNDTGALPKLFSHEFHNQSWMLRCLHDQQTVDDFMLSTHWRMLLVGNDMSGMFNHKDTLEAGSWQAQISGRKRWHLCAPSQDPYVGRAGQVDSFRPHYDKYPAFENATCTDDVVGPGEIIYYPANYWHQTESLRDNHRRPSIAISGTVVDPYSHATVAKSLRRQCSANGTLRIPKHVCDLLTDCYKVWEQDWGTASGGG